MSVQLTPILTKFWDHPESWTLKTYEENEGYQAFKQAVGMSQAALVDLTKDSGLRGRGGAGFPTGLKWSFLPPPDGGPRYLVVNADESEPGTCKDIPLMMAAPHFLIEGVAITSFAIGCNHAFIYLRGEVVHVYRRLLHAVEEAYAAGYLGKNIQGTGFDLEVTVHAGAGAYICGEETALLDSLEGRRGQPRLKPPFPAVAGLYARPTVVNNVESIASIPPILLHGSDWFKDMGTDKSTGFGIFSLSGHVKRPGQFEAPLGITLRELLDMAGGMRDPQHKLKFWTPGGSSTPLFTDAHLDVPLDFESVAAAGSMLGTRALQIFDDTTCVVRATERWTDFYKHESCGKCTPCREGTWWLAQILERLEHGQGDEEDIEKLVDICDNILGRSFCALGDGATSPITSSVEYFRDEYLEHLRLGRCPFDRDASTLFATGHHRGEGAGVGMTTTVDPTHHAAPARAATPSAPAATPGAPRARTTSRSPSTASRPGSPRGPSSSGPPRRSGSRSRGSATTRSSSRSAPAASASSTSRRQGRTARCGRCRSRRRPARSPCPRACRSTPS